MESRRMAERLQEQGFQPEEIERLQELRREYREREQEHQRRLEFVRWLVGTGRMTDGIAHSRR